MEKYQCIANYLRFISETYCLEICIKDFIGFLDADRELRNFLQPYLIHRNPFCMQVKSNKKLWDRCLLQMQSLMKKARKLKSTFYGMCYCGIEEYIVPVISKGGVIGAICAGEYSSRRDVSACRIEKASRENDMDLGLLMQKFAQTVRDEPHDKMQVESLLGIVAELLASYFEGSAAAYYGITAGENSKRSAESYILSHAVEFIRQNFKNNITMKDITNFCHCSESYISHIFKKNMKMNIRAFINMLRMEQAKVLLSDTGESIAEIAAEIGFNDPNYFSRVFGEMCSMTPTEYRKVKNYENAGDRQL